MATTATLNGGPTGGLHATPSIHSEQNPPQEEPLDSNSSFESGGHEDPSGQTSWAHRPSGLTSEPSYYMDTSGAKDGSKKRRKQSRPVRIPASQLPPGAEPSAPPVHIPLNLSGRTEESSENCSSGDEEEGTDSRCRGDLTDPTAPSFNENYKTDQGSPGGQKTKDPNLNNNRINSSAGSPSLPPSFSPGLFPLVTSSPFSSLFPGHLFSQQQGHQSHHHSNHHSNQQNQQPRPPRTPTSSASSVGSNSGGSQAGVIIGGGPSTLTNLPPHRIFNPEAYCDLCNKEFCNKYFLKTHKANKHGVYSEMSPNLGQMMGPGISSSGGSSFLPGTPLLSSVGLLTAPSTTPGGSGGQVQGSLGLPLSLSSSILGQSGEVNKSELPFSLSFSSVGEKGAPGNGCSQTRESFCELCQKEFCNKYFLKRHKAKIHGIGILEGSSSAGGSGRSSSSSNPSKRTSANGNSTATTNTNNENKPSEALSHTLREMGLESLGLELVTKHLAEESESQHRHTHRHHHHHHHSDEGRRDNSEREEGEVGPYSMDDPEDCPDRRGGDGGSPENPIEDEVDNSNNGKMSSALSQLGNVGTRSANSENTCQFCFRDFQSRQLLYTHLLKKHRLLIPSTFPPFLLPFPSLFEEGGNGVPEGGATGALPIVDNNGNATTGEGDFECTLCDRTFQTIYLLRMHKSYFHPDSADDTDPVTSKFITDAAASFIAAAGNNRTSKRNPTSGTDEEEGFNSDHDGDSSGKGTPSITEDESKGARSVAKNILSTSLEMEGRGEGTSDSDDLRRLQTMIMELNRVSSAAVAWSPPLDSGAVPQPSLTSGSTYCQICSKEFYSTYFLQQHIQHYHTAPVSTSLNPSTNTTMGGGEIRIKSESALASPSPGGGGIESPHSMRIKSELMMNSEVGGAKKSPCGASGELTISQGTLKERLLNPEGYIPGSSGPNDLTFLTPGPKSGNNNNSLNNNNNNNNAMPKVDNSSGKRPSPSLSRSYCTICHKELCNKYFMRTHMLKMHGISIESSTGLGGVTCDICNKELCSKYFLKVHKQNTHGIVEEGPSPPNPSTPGPIVTSSSSANFPLLGSTGLGLNLSINSSSPHLTSSGDGGNGALSSLLDPLGSSPLLGKEPMDLQTRYFCHYSEVCPFCGRRFRSPKWLKSHLTSDHGEEGRERWKSIEKTLNLGRRGGGGSKGSSGKSNCPSGGQFKGSSGSTSGGTTTGTSNNKSSSGTPLLKSSGLTRDGNKCAFCNFSSGDMDLMKGHLIKEHGNQLTGRNETLGYPEGQSMLLDPLTLLFQKMEGGSNKLYRCTYCPFTTSILAYLYAHERTHSGLGVTAPQGTTGSEGPTFQCPMCFHTFDQPEAFQQHLIGHQMSGVLAPFFTPTTSSNSGGRLGFLTSPPGGGAELSPDPRALLSLPLLNGNAGENLYWALKNVPSGRRNGERGKSKTTGENESDAADLSTTVSKRRRLDVEEGGIVKKKVSHFRCSQCEGKFKTREECLTHIQMDHRRPPGDERRSDENRKRCRQIPKKTFRCRKCKFGASSYQNLVVHCKVQHSALRPFYSNVGGGVTTRSISTGTVEEVGRGVAQEAGEFLIQGFLLTSSESEESSNQSSGPFVPSLVYLPVREKVSQSIRVSFSLTPTS